MPSSKIPFNYEQVRLLAVLALINFVNFADRQVLNPLVPLLRQHFGVTDTQLGSLQWVLLVVLALASIPSGYLADRFNEPRIIASWSFILEHCRDRQWTGAHVCVFIRGARPGGYWRSRICPAAQSLISDSFSKDNRAMAQSIFAAGMILGGVSGLALGGVMGERHGWQHAFIIVGLLGVIPGLTALKLKAAATAPTFGSCSGDAVAPRAGLCGHDCGGNLHHVLQRFLRHLGH